jgi:hypothetical protein
MSRLQKDSMIFSPWQQLFVGRASKPASGRTKRLRAPTVAADFIKAVWT